MKIFRSLFGLTDNNRPRTTHAILLMIVFLHGTNRGNLIVSGQAIIPFLQTPEEGADNGAVLRSFLEPCEAVTLQTQCTEEEYESNEDCLPQKKDNCDRSKELFCLSGVCLPNCHPHKETYDHVDGKCFRKVGSDCKSFNASTKMKMNPTRLPSLLNSNEDNQGQENQQQQQKHSTVIVPECEKNAVCEKGQCRCAKNFTYDHNFSKCMRAANYASYCNETISCDRKSDIVCNENQCQCKSPEIQYYHLKRKRCYVLIGQVCSNGLQFCPDNSNCVRNKATDGKLEGDNANEIIFSSSIPPYRIGNSTGGNEHKHRLRLLYEEHRNDINDRLDAEDEHFIGIWGDDDEEKEFVCKCERGYGSIRDKRFCLGLYGARCNTLHRCNMERGLKCVDGVCRCQRGNEQVFSEQFQTCITRVGAPCIDDGRGEREEDICPIGASCKTGKCTCDKGLTPATSSSNMASIAHSCMKSHGMSCKSNNSIGNNGSSAGVLPIMPQDTDVVEPPCNHEIGLECSEKEGKCLCKDSTQFYDVRMKKCRSFHTTDAKIPVIHFAPPDDREYNFRRNSGSRSSIVTLSINPQIFVIVLNIFAFYF